MTPFLLYLGGVSLCLILLSAFYVLTLRRTTFFATRRVYLLLALGLSCLIPLAPASFFPQAEILKPQWPQQFYTGQQARLTLPQAVEANSPLSPTVQKKGAPSLSAAPLLSLLYFGGVLYFGLHFLLSLGKIIRAIRCNTWSKQTHFWLAHTSYPSTFSFGSFLFLSREHAALPQAARETVVKHEEVHIRQGHTWDILLVKTLQVFQWFNPLHLFLLREFRTLHECQADRVISETVDKQSYAQFLLQLAHPKPSLALTQAFAQVALKKRIQLLFQPPSSRWQLLWLLPACLLLTTLTLGFSMYKGEIAPLSQADGMGELQPQVPYLSPLENPRITSTYGMRKHPQSGELLMHKGVDFGAPLGTPVRATGDGVVYLALGRTNGNQGWFIEINHGDGIISHYANLLGDPDSVRVQRKQAVKAGDIIGYVGNSGRYSTGPHLHYEIRKESQHVDPALYLPKEIFEQPAEKGESHKFRGGNGAFIDGIPHLAPLKNPVIFSGYGQRMHPILKVRRMHFGLDFVAKMGTEVLATGTGKVVEVNKAHGGYGAMVKLEHGGGIETLYAHLQREGIQVTEGEVVAAGQVIALSGNSGLSQSPHLHYEVLEKGRKVDPKGYLPGIQSE